MKTSRPPTPSPGSGDGEQDATASTGSFAKTIFVNKNVSLLWFGQLISRLGDWCLWIAVPTTIYNTTNSRIDLAFTIVTEALPFLIFSPVAGAIVDRFDRRRTMIIADIGRALMVALLIAPRGSVPLSLYYGVLFGCSALSAFFGPARIAIMTQLVPQRQLVRINAMLATGMEMSELAGPVIGGFVLAELLQRGSFVIDIVSFVVSAFCIGALSLKTQPAVRGTALTVRSAIDDLRAGMSVLLRTPVARGMMIWWNIGYFATAIFVAMLYPIAKDALHSDVRHFGFMMSCDGAGLLTAGIAVSTVLHRYKSERLVLTGLVLATLSCFGVAWTHSFAECCVALFVFGFGGLLVNVTAQTMAQTAVEPNMLGRFFGMFAFVGRLAQLVGTAAAGVLASAVSLNVTYCVATALYLLSTIFAFFLLRDPNPAVEPSPQPAHE